MTIFMLERTLLLLSEEEVHHLSSWASHTAVSGAKREGCVSGPFLCGASRADQHEHHGHDTSQKSKHRVQSFFWKLHSLPPDNIFLRQQACS